MSKSLADNPFITEAKDKNGDSWYHQIILEKKDKEIIKLRDENKILNNKIEKALHKLKASKDHFKTQRENNAITFTIRILEENK